MVTLIVLIEKETGRIPARADRVTGLAGFEPGLY